MLHEVQDIENNKSLLHSRFKIYACYYSAFKFQNVNVIASYFSIWLSQKSTFPKIFTHGMLSKISLKGSFPLYLIHQHC